MISFLGLSLSLHDNFFSPHISSSHDLFSAPKNNGQLEEQRSRFSPRAYEPLILGHSTFVPGFFA
jgi:hypothetical protein